jgi:predicted PhzF superfamily epimerase YddE/YHI9
VKLPLYWVDAFASRVFEGNPAAVVPLSSWLPDGLMQRIAFENGLAETAFLVRSGDARFHLRWFTPKLEVDLCGHATLAAAHAAFTQLGHSGDTLTFDSRSGPLMVARLGDRYELDFPARPTVPTHDIPRGLLTSLRIAPREIQIVAGHLRYLAIYETVAQVLSLQPDFPLLATLGDGRVIATAPGEDCDFVSRFFAPGAGVPEDPVTGSAHCSLVPYWAHRLSKSRLHARQVSARGGELWCELRGDRVAMAGHAVLYLHGEIEV